MWNSLMKTWKCPNMWECGLCKETLLGYIYIYIYIYNFVILIVHLLVIIKIVKDARYMY